MTARANVFGPVLAMIRARQNSAHRKGRRYHPPMTQAELARIAGVSRGMIAAVETGRKMLRCPQLDNILRHFGLEWKRGLDFTWSTHHGDDYCLVRPNAEILIVHRESGEPYLQGVIEQTRHGTWKISPTSDKEPEN